MLNTAAAKELAGTKAGDRALAAFPGGLKITVRPCDGAYSRYDAQAGAIILDSETIQQYMRLKGYTAASLMNSPARVAEIALYMSPVVVYEAAHKMQADWTAKLGVYKPHVQEDEIEAMSLEGLYTAEKMAKDPEYARLLSSSGDFSSYASKKLGIGTEYAMSGSKKFANTVRQRYSSGLPSLDAAAAQVLDAVAGELDRRAGLPAAGKAALDTAGLGLADALEMSPEELAGSAGEMQSSVLAKIQKDFSGLGAYGSRYSASDRQGRKGLRPLKSGEQYNPGAPPPL